LGRRDASLIAGCRHLDDAPLAQNAHGRVGDRILNLIATLALLFSIVACTEPQSIALSVERANLTQDVSGRAALKVFLSKQSEGDFAIYTAKHSGQLIEFQFLNQTLTRVRIRSAIAGGDFLISAPTDPAIGTLDESNAAEIARKLSSGSANLEVRVVN
jgi:hypothetical protein